MQTCLRCNGQRCQLHAIVVMPDHVHLALSPHRDQQRQEFTIPKIMQEIKSISSHRINRELTRSGRVWQEESFDRAMRSAEDLDLKIEYMINNPVRAGIVSVPSEYRWLWTEGFVGTACTSTGEGARGSIVNQ